jgi:hypothetical protein
LTVHGHLDGAFLTRAALHEIERQGRTGGLI